jgi:hypothetical protein
MSFQRVWIISNSLIFRKNVGFTHPVPYSFVGWNLYCTEIYILWILIITYFRPYSWIILLCHIFKIKLYLFSLHCKFFFLVSLSSCITIYIYLRSLPFPRACPSLLALRMTAAWHCRTLIMAFSSFPSPLQPPEATAIARSWTIAHTSTHGDTTPIHPLSTACSVSRPVWLSLAPVPVREASCVANTASALHAVVRASPKTCIRRKHCWVLSEKINFWSCVYRLCTVSGSIYVCHAYRNCGCILC